MKGRAPYPPERTLLTTGIIDAVMESRVAGNGRLLTPHLSTPTFTYESYDTLPARPRGPAPSGACLDPDAPDENWNEGGTWVGKASMSARHRSDERLEHTRSSVSSRRRVSA